MTLPDLRRTNLERLHAWEVLVSLAEEYRVDVDRVIAGDRKRLPTQCRHHMWRILRDTLDLDMSELARLWGVDHSTVTLAMRKSFGQIAPDFPRAKGATT